MVQWLKGAQREPWLQAGLVSPPTGIPSPWSVSGTEEPFDGEGDVPETSVSFLGVNFILGGSAQSQNSPT